MLNSGKHHVSVFLDLLKALDTLDHGILMSKLDRAGIRGKVLRWLNSYTSGRQQSLVTCVNRKYLLRVIYYPGFLKVLYWEWDRSYFWYTYQRHCKSAPTLHYVHFADDSTVSASRDDIYNLIDILNNALSNIRMWIQGNRLSLNAIKTIYIVISNKYCHENLQLKIGNPILNRVKKQNFLGI